MQQSPRVASARHTCDLIYLLLLRRLARVTQQTKWVHKRRHPTKETNPTVSCEVRNKKEIGRNLEMFLLVDGGPGRTEKEKDADAQEDEALIMYLH